MVGLIERIDRWCQAFGKSEAELARRAGLPAPNYFSRMRRGSVNGRKHFQAIANAMECDLVWLTTGNGPPPKWWNPRSATSTAETADPAASPVSGMSEVELLRFLLEQQRQLMTLKETLLAMSTRLTRLEEERQAPGDGAAPSPTGAAHKPPRAS